MTRAALGMFALVALLLVACGAEKAAPPARPTPTPTLERTAGPIETRQVSDMTGRTVEIPLAVDRVVVLSQSAADFAAALKLDIVGHASDAQAPGAPVGSSLSPDFKAAAALTPDLVIADAAFQGARLRDFEQFPYAVYMIKVARYQEVIDGLRALGEATGHADGAEAAVTSIEERVDAARARTQGKQAPSVLIMTGAGRDVYGASEATYAGDLAKLLGAKNVLGASLDGAPLAGFGAADVGQLAAKAPDIVLTISSGAGGLAAAVKSNAAWAQSQAVLSGRVFELDPKLYLRAPGPKIGRAHV